MKTKREIMDRIRDNELEIRRLRDDGKYDRASHLTDYNFALRWVIE